MSWLQKRPQVSTPVNFYTVGLNKTVLVVGLGNIGKDYDLTRHNVGFYCVDSFVKAFDELQDWTNKKDLHCHFSSGQIGDKRVMVIKPTTLMNNSGQAVEAVVNFYKLEASNILVVHDELDIDFGQIRIRQGGSSAGHNGIKSISKSLGSDDYGRIRIGIGPKSSPKIDSSDFVLQKFNDQQLSQMDSLAKEVIAIITEHLFGSGELVTETRSFLA